MAKLHSRKKGKSGSNKPIEKVVPEWCTYKKEQVEELVVNFFKEGIDITTIGLILRDEYGIPSVKNITGKKISQILKEEKILSDFPDDILNLIKKAVRMREHLNENKQDKINKKKLIDTESKIQRLSKYYLKNNRIKKGWKYDPESAKLLVK